MTGERRGWAPPLVAFSLDDLPHVTAMSSDETNQLLREIRDLQKAHFDYYVQFTQQIQRSQDDAEKAAVDRAKEDAAYAEEQRAFQQEMRDVSRRNSRNAVVVSIILVVALGSVVVVAALGSVINFFIAPP